MNVATVIRRGKHYNITLASVRFDKFGDVIDHVIITCDDWAEGMIRAKKAGHDHALFLDSGTVIADFDRFRDNLSRYPHYGLIGHLIWHKDQNLYLDPQCWFVDLARFDVDDLTRDLISHPTPTRSNKNIHDDHTPLWVSPGDGHVSYASDRFGQGLIARQLSDGRTVVNWNQTIRDIKHYIYPGNCMEQLDGYFREYLDLASSQLWIFNNEPLKIIGSPSLVTPASGLSWMINLLHPTTQRVQLVDISHRQIEFAHALWQEWDGTDYGQFCWNFITANDLQHWQLDRPDLSPIDRLKLKSPARFIQYVNEQFAQITAQVDLSDFASAWQRARSGKKVSFCRGNIVDLVLQDRLDSFDAIWTSNILDYKWTLLHSTADECLAFQEKIRCKMR